MTLLISLVVVAVVFAIVLSMVLTRFLYICQPNEVLVFSGGQRASVGRKVGYRIIKGGRALRIPLLETVDSMDLTNMPIEVAVQGAYSKGGIPVNVHGIANVKIAGEQPVLDNAIERFLGVDRSRIMAIAKDTLEGNLRGVLATLTPEELNEDKIKFAQSLLAEAEDDLRKLGLELDTLKIQDVSDDVNYLDSIGRRQSAEVQKNALIAEARAKAESAVRSASNRRETELSKIEAQITTARADNARRLADAQTRSGALVAEAQGQVASQLARAEGELEVQKARIEQVKRQLAADVLEPARASKAAAEANAKGAAAHDHRAGAGDRLGHGPDRRHLARRRSGGAQRLPDAEGRGSHAHRHEHGRVAEGRPADRAGRGRGRRGRQRFRDRAARPDRQADRRQRADQGRDRDRHRRRPAGADAAATAGLAVSRDPFRQPR